MMFSQGIREKPINQNTGSFCPSDWQKSKGLMTFRVIVNVNGGAPRCRVGVKTDMNLSWKIL